VCVCVSVCVCVCVCVLVFECDHDSQDCLRADTYLRASVHAHILRTIRPMISFVSASTTYVCVFVAALRITILE
jgi:hypothetical protein